MKKRHYFFAALALTLVCLISACASTGPSISRYEIKQKEEEFHLKFYEASKIWLPRVYRVGYRLVTSHVPEHGDEQPKFQFVGVGVEELKGYSRKAYGVDKSIKGVLVLGLYPGSRADGNVDLQPGDVILSVDSKKVKNLGAYFKQIRNTEKDSITFKIWRHGGTLERAIPVEKVYYNAQFFLAPTPDFDAHAAFSKIHVGIGAIRYSRNDDELGVIIGHELAHTTLKHSMKKLGASVSTAIAYGAVAGLIDAFTFPGVGSALMQPAQQATEAAISRRYEREADYYGMQHAFHAGFDVESGSKVFSRLASDAPGFEVLAYTFSTHPKSPERFLRLEKMVEEFRTKYPERFPLEKSPDWEIVISPNAGESLEDALNRLLEQSKQAQKLPADISQGPAVSIPGVRSGLGTLPGTVNDPGKALQELAFGPTPTTSGINTANPANPGKSQASGYPVPKRS